MANRNFNGAQINQSVTIVEQAGAAITDCRNRIMVYDENGNVVLATDGKKPIIGVALIESGLIDISGKESGKVAVGDDVEIYLGQNIRYLREAKGLTQEGFAASIGDITDKAVCNWEAGRREPKLSSLITVTDIGISGSNEMDTGKSFSLSVHMNGGRLWAKNWQRLLRKTE